MPKAIARLRAQRLGDCSITALTRLTFSGVLTVLGLAFALGIVVVPVFFNALVQRLIVNVFTWRLHQGER